MLGSAETTKRATRRSLAVDLANRRDAQFGAMWPYFSMPNIVLHIG